MYLPIELARHAISEFDRGLEGLTDDEARRRIATADGSEMNAISWTVGHIAGHWLNRPFSLKRYANGSDDPTPPSLNEARDLLSGARTFVESWLSDAEDDVLAARPDGVGGESVGTGVMRAALHTWFHTGEINAIRQQLGHAEIAFIGDMLGVFEWRPSADGSLGGYPPAELGRFAIAEFERGLEGMTDEELQRRLDKADGSQMNGATWVIAHVATHWAWDAFLLGNAPLPNEALTFFGRSADPTPPPPADMRAFLASARNGAEAWLPALTDDLLSSKRDTGPQAEENLGTQFMRAVLHTWFHTGEINAIRQLLGHEEISYVGQLVGNLEWGGVSGA